MLIPQHFTLPVFVTAHACWYPAAMRTTPAVSPVTSTGIRLKPVPPFPIPPRPQHLTPPAVVKAQVCVPPAASAVTPLTSPLTRTGVNRSVIVPSPSCPTSFFPQHWTPPAAV